MSGMAWMDVMKTPGSDMKFTLSGPCRIRCCQALEHRWGGRICDFFHISEERGFGFIILIMGLGRGTCKLVEVHFFGLKLYRRTVVLLRCGKFERVLYLR